MRRRYIDSAGGLLLLHMVLWHCSRFAGVAADYQRYSALLACFMPWFFYKGGMFFRQKGIAKAVKDGARRLLLPFAAFTAVGIALDLLRFCLLDHQSFGDVCSHEAHSLVVNGAVPGNLALWFLPSLFAVRIIYALCQRMAPAFKYAALVLIAAVPFLAYGLMGQWPHAMPLWLVNIPIGLFFYAVGDLAGPRSDKPHAAFAAMCIAYVIIMAICPTIGDARNGAIEMGSRWAWYPLALLGIWSINALCHWLLSAPNILSWIGERTMTIYCWHWPIIVITAMLLPDVCSGWWRFAALAAIVLVTLPAIALTAKND